MNEQMEQPQPRPAGQVEMEEAPPVDAVTTFLEALATAVGVETVFGDPITAGDRVIIPVAETAIGGGAGFGQGPSDREGRPRRMQLAVGSGAGGGASTRPVAAIIVTPEEVRVQPILDVGKLALTGIASTGALWQGVTAFIRAMRKR